MAQQAHGHAEHARPCGDPAVNVLRPAAADGRKAIVTMTIPNAPEALEAETKVVHGTWYAWYAVILLTGCYTLAFVDSKIPFILIEAIKADLALTDTQLGIIAGPAFSLVYAIGALPIAKLSDRISRKYVIATAVSVWSAFTAAGGATQSFLPFMLSRTGVALGESALTPAAHSIFADLFPEARRPTAIAIYSCGIAMGFFLALSLGGILSDRLGWRSTLVIVGVVGFVLSLLVLTTLREPTRDLRPTGKQISRGSIVALFADPAIRNTIIGGTALGIANGSASAWSAAYVMRTFHLSASATGATYGTLVGILTIAGTLCGGLVAARLSSRDVRYGFRLLAVAFLVATIAKLCSLATSSYVLFLLFAALSGLLQMFYPGPTYATIQSLAKPDARSFASAVTMFCINAVGLAGGAFLTGWLSDQLKDYFGPESLRYSLAILSLMSIWSAFHYWRASYHLGKRMR
ncbi:spinster family MFS transporter [Bradyrhizobium liaoningense]|uniref:spinster family MFS transporter n=1 Tax=Bradyrhizobium liaoningense TaxID=43992 RepID=UPI001BA9C6E2|nr:MFS transporter [Bradyrhizobium liaoningense]MBR0858050.1 MFS transporter [Bradyrhizobium liaoningense]